MFGWISVLERLPDDKDSFPEKKYLITDGNRHEIAKFVRAGEPDKLGWVVRGRVVQDVTHWQRLPFLPIKS